MARCIAMEDGEVPTSDSPTLSLHQRLSLSHPVVAGRYDTLHPDLDPFWQWVAMKQARENPRGDFIRDTRVLIHVGKNPGSRVWSACDEARREYRKLCRQWELRSAPANRRDAKPKHPTSAPPPAQTQTRTAPPHPGPFDAWRLAADRIRHLLALDA